MRAQGQVFESGADEVDAFCFHDVLSTGVLSNLGFSHGTESHVAALPRLQQSLPFDEGHHLVQALQRLQVGHHEGFEHALRIGARMVVYRRGQLLAMYLVTQVADYPSVSAKFWEKALEMIERRQICSGGQGTTIPA